MADALDGHGGRRGPPRTTLVRIAAPVGVVSSALMVEGASGTPLSNSAVPGVGTGMMPWAHFTVPLPVGTGVLVKCSTASRSNPTAAPTMSAMLSSRADFVEVDALERHPVNGRFGHRDLAEDRGREFALLQRKRAFSEDRFHVRQEAVVFLVGGFDGRFGRGEAAPLHSLDFEFNRQAERVEPPREWPRPARRRR